MTESTPFEGVEKRLVIQFAPEVIDTSASERKTGKMKSPLMMSQEEWQKILNYANCSIVSVREMEDTKVYLLSESSLVVWKYGFLMKTCGRTTPFLALEKFMSPYVVDVNGSPCPEQSSVAPAAVGDGVNWMTYSRLEFIHPEYQIYPHQSFPQEIDYLKKLFGDQKVHSMEIPAGANILYAAFVSNGRPITQPYSMQEVLMMRIDRMSVKNLTGYDNYTERTQSANSPSHKNYLEESIRHVARHEVDQYWFDPYGYSANILMSNTPGIIDYFSCHISPELETSYASLEVGRVHSSTTGFDMAKLVQHFHPKRLQLTNFTIRQTTEKDSTRKPATGAFVEGQIECIISHTAWMQDHHLHDDELALSSAPEQPSTREPVCA